MTTASASVTVQKIATWVPITLEALVDSGNASPEQIAEYKRLEAERAAEQKAAWTALPLRRRISIRWSTWKWQTRRDLHHRFFADFEREDYD